MRPQQLVPDSSQSIVARSAAAFDVRVAGDLVSMIHVMTEDTIALIQ